MFPHVKKRVWTFVKAVTFVMCLAGFVCNTFMIFRQFIGKQTITSWDVQRNKELLLPSFTICSLTGVKNRITKYQHLELNSYINNTLELDEILVSIDDLTINELREDTAAWQFSTIYSQFKGRCHTVRHILKVRKRLF